MSIEIRPSGEAQAYAGAGRVIGKAKARETAKEEAQRAQELAFRQRAQQMSNDWELQKMLLNSQLDFQHEQRMIQIEQEKFERAKAWDVEKMELRARLDFQKEEQKTQKQLSIVDNDIDGITKYIKDNGIDEKSGEWVSLQNKLSELDEQKRNIKLGLKPYGMKPAGWQYLTPEEQKQAARIGAGLEPRAGEESAVEQYFKQRSEGGLGTPEPPVENVYVKFPDGQILSVSITKVMPNGLTELQEALINDKGVILPGQNIPSQESPIQEKPMRETPSFIRPPTFPGWLPSNRRQ